GYLVEQFPVNVKGCRGSSLCNLGCPNQAKQGTNRVQLPRAERAGVEVATRAEVLRIEPDRTLTVRVSQKAAGTKGAPSEWAPGDYQVRARIVVAAAGAIGTPALLLRSPLPAPRPRPPTAWCVGPARQPASFSPPGPGASMRPPIRHCSKPPMPAGSKSASPPTTSGPACWPSPPRISWEGAGWDGALPTRSPT